MNNSPMPEVLSPEVAQLTKRIADLDIAIAKRNTQFPTVAPEVSEGFLKVTNQTILRRKQAQDRLDQITPKAPEVATVEPAPASPLPASKKENK